MFLQQSMLAYRRPKHLKGMIGINKILNNIIQNKFTMKIINFSNHERVKTDSAVINNTDSFTRSINKT